MAASSTTKTAAASGVDGVLVTDLPPEEAGDLRGALVAQGVDLIFLLSPTSSRERVDRICREASGFVYFVSRTGVTGAPITHEEVLEAGRQAVPRLGGLIEAVVQRLAESFD